MKRIGTRLQVMRGIAKQTGGGLQKKDLKYNKYGKIISKKVSIKAKKAYYKQSGGGTELLFKLSLMALIEKHINNHKLTGNKLIEYFNNPKITFNRIKRDFEYLDIGEPKLSSNKRKEIFNKTFEQLKLKHVKNCGVCTIYNPRNAKYCSMCGTPFIDLAVNQTHTLPTVHPAASADAHAAAAAQPSPGLVAAAAPNTQGNIEGIIIKYSKTLPVILNRSKLNSLNKDSNKKYLVAQATGLNEYDNTSITDAYNELKRNKKKTLHYIWYVFPTPPYEGASKINKRFELKDDTDTISYITDQNLVKNYKIMISLVYTILNDLAKQYRGVSGYDLLQIILDTDAAKFKSSIMHFKDKSKHIDPELNKMCEHIINKYKLH